MVFSKRGRSYGYERLEKAPASNTDSVEQSKQSTPPIWLLMLAMVVWSIALVVATWMLVAVDDRGCARRLSTWSPGLDVVEYETRMFKAGLQRPSPFKGTPGPGVDMAWANITSEYKFYIDEGDLKKIRKSTNVVQKDGRYIATVEVFHQLHCLNLIRRYTYKDYYLGKEGAVAFGTSPEHLREHVDHCIDILRQTLMCNADVGLLTFDWVKGHSKPYPDFNTYHQCRKFDAILDWARSLDRHWTVSDIIKPDNAVEDADFPDPED